MESTEQRSIPDLLKRNPLAQALLDYERAAAAWTRSYSKAADDRYAAAGERLRALLLAAEAPAASRFEPGQHVHSRSYGEACSPLPSPVGRVLGYTDDGLVRVHWGLQIDEHAPSDLELVEEESLDVWADLRGRLEQADRELSELEAARVEDPDWGPQIEADRLRAKRSGIRVALDYMRGYGCVTARLED